jgi:predicted transcriptional regulator
MPLKSLAHPSQITPSRTIDIMIFFHWTWIRCMPPIARNEEFWIRHIITGIPQPLRKRINELGDYIIIESEPTEIFQPHKQFMKKLLDSKWIKGVSPIFHPEYPNAFVQLANKGVEISLILTKNVFDKVEAEYKEELKKFLGYKNATMMVCEEEILVAFTVTDLFLSLGLFFKEGEYDTHHDLQSTEGSAIKWGEDLFNYYKVRSKEITLKEL